MRCCVAASAAGTLSACDRGKKNTPRPRRHPRPRGPSSTSRWADAGAAAGDRGGDGVVGTECAGRRRAPCRRLDVAAGTGPPRSSCGARGRAGTAAEAPRSIQAGRCGRARWIPPRCSRSASSCIELCWCRSYRDQPCSARRLPPVSRTSIHICSSVQSFYFCSRPATERAPNMPGEKVVWERRGAGRVIRRTHSRLLLLRRLPSRYKEKHWQKWGAVPLQKE